MLKFYNSVVGVFSSVFIGLFCYSCFFVLPNVEDLYLSVLPAKFGTYDFVRFFSSTFTGRYTANFLDGVNPLAFGLWQYYPAYILLNFFLNLGATIGFVKVFLKTTWGESILIGSLTTALFLFISPSLFFTYYNLTVCFVYILPITFLLINSSLFILYFRKSDNKKFTLFILLSFSVFLGIGLNEMFLPLYLILTLLALIYVRVNQKNQLKHIIPLALIVILSISFFIASPGSLARAEGDSINLLFIFKNSTILYIQALKQYTLALPAFIIVSVSYFIRNKTPKINLSLSFFLWWLLPYAITIPYFFGRPRTEYLETRIYIPVIFLFLFIATFIALPAFWRLLEAKWKDMINSKPFSKTIQIISIIVLGIVSLQTFYGKVYNLGYIMKDFENGKIQQFQQLNLRNLQKLQQAKLSPAKNEIVYLEETNDYPESLYHKIHNENNRYNSLWNLGLEGYFDVNEVRICGENQTKFSNR